MPHKTFVKDASTGTYCATRRDTTLIYRLETSDGDGVYVSGIMSTVGEAVGTSLFNCEGNHPSPWDDPDIRRVWCGFDDAEARSRWFFGFASLDAIRRWLGDPAVSRSLSARGVRVVVYAAPRSLAHHGRRQSIFRKQDATQVATLPVPRVKKGVSR